MITQSELKALLEYDPISGVFTNLRDSCGRTVGKRAGYAHHGYRVIEIKGRVYLEHRLAWLYVTGAWPKLHLDHANTDRGDNRWNNLREATRSQNRANSRALTKNAVGVKGVWSQHGSYYARIRVNDKRIYLGAFPTIEEAAAAYAAAATKHFGVFARTE